MCFVTSNNVSVTHLVHTAIVLLPYTTGLYTSDYTALELCNINSHYYV